MSFTMMLQSNMNNHLHDFILQPDKHDSYLVHNTQLEGQHNSAFQMSGSTQPWDLPCVSNKKIDN